MKVVILAGGRGTRISEESDVKPKPMIEIGGRPILWHIMKHYSKYGFNEFVICTGYKGYIIKEYFHNYYQHTADCTIDLKHNVVDYHNSVEETWHVTLVDTGLDTLTGSRIKRIQKYVGKERFMLTYGDGVSDVNIDELIKNHENSGVYATTTAVRASGKYGAIKINDDGLVKSFTEKPWAWISGGFFVLEHDIFDYINCSDKISWEKEPLENLAKESQLNAYKHVGFWKSMDTLSDKLELEHLWSIGKWH